MEVKRLRTLTLKVFKALNNMDPEYMKEIFHKQPSRRRDLLIQRLKKNHTTKYRKKSLRFLGPQIWNSCSTQIKKSN